MNTKTREKLKELSKNLLTAKAAVDLAELDTVLSRYQDFVISPKERLSEVTDYESYLAYVKEWRECGKIKGLPAELAKYYKYLSLASEYNAILAEELPLGEKATEFVPVFFNEKELSVLTMVEKTYGQNMPWDKIKARFLSENMKLAVYKHAVSILSEETLLDEFEAGRLTGDRIKSLPLAISVCESMGEGSLTDRYAANLKALYNAVGYALREPVILSEKVKGVTFDGRSDKLLKIWNTLKPLLNENEESFDAEKTDYSEVLNFRKNLHIEFERYIYTDPDGNSEPAIRVLASLKGDRLLKKVDIGNLPRETAIELAKTHPDACLTGEISSLGLMQASGKDGTVHQPYARVSVMVTDRPYEIEKTNEKDILENEEIR